MFKKYYFSHLQRFIAIQIDIRANKRSINWRFNTNAIKENLCLVTLTRNKNYALFPLSFSIEKNIVHDLFYFFKETWNSIWSFFIVSPKHYVLSIVETPKVIVHYPDSAPAMWGNFFIVLSFVLGTAVFIYYTRTGIPQERNTFSKVSDIAEEIVSSPQIVNYGKLYNYNLQQFCYRKPMILHKFSADCLMPLEKLFAYLNGDIPLPNITATAAVTAVAAAASAQTVTTISIAEGIISTPSIDVGNIELPPPGLSFCAWYKEFVRSGAVVPMPGPGIIRLCMKQALMADEAYWNAPFDARVNGYIKIAAAQFVGWINGNPVGNYRPTKGSLGYAQCFMRNVLASRGLTDTQIVNLFQLQESVAIEQAGRAL